MVYMNKETGQPEHRILQRKLLQYEDELGELMQNNNFSAENKLHIQEGMQIKINRLKDLIQNEKDN